MSRLLCANFSRLFKSGVFRAAMLFNAFLLTYAVFNRYFDMKTHSEIFEELGVTYRSADGLAFAGGVFTVFLLAVVVAAFVGTEYSDGTIRNKLMVGHKRGAIYLANFITCTAAGIMLFICSLVFCYGIGAFLLPESYLTLGEIITFSLMECLTLTALSAILVFIAMLVHSKSASAVTALLLVFMMLMMTLTLEEKLREPEFYGEGGKPYIEIIDFDTETGVADTVDRSGEPNPYYVGGVKRVIMQGVFDAMPVSQAVYIQIGETERLPIMAAYSVGVIVVFTGAGLLLFRKKNIK